MNDQAPPPDPAGAAQDRIVPGVGGRIRAARLDAKISLREMGRRVGVSASFLSQVELGRATPSIGTLYGVVSELDLSIDSLLGDLPPDEADAATAIVVDAAPRDRAPLPEGWSGIQRVQRAGHSPDIRVGGVRWQRLTLQDDPLVEFLRVTYSAGSELCPADNLMRHAGWEYLTVLAGKVDVQVGFNRDILSAGESLDFDSTIPHRFSNPYAVDCVAIWAVVGRHGFAHPLELAERLGAAGSSAEGGSLGSGSHYSAQD